MKFINPSVEYWEQSEGIDGIWSQIARATRVCYQSKPREGETDKEFVERVILKPAQNKDDSYDLNKMHGAMLEHGTVYLTLPCKFDEMSYYEIVHSDYNRVRFGNNNDYHYIKTNIRYMLEHNKLADLQYATNPTKWHIRRYTFSVITDIGVTREMNRHRTFSVAEMSTRYCDFNKDKFGGELTFIIPAWINKEVITTDDIETKRQYYILCQGAENTYRDLRQLGWKPEQARQVLPLGLKTQAVYTAFEDDWEHFLALRADNVSGKVHPNMAIIADMIKDKFEEITNEGD